MRVSEIRGMGTGEIRSKLDEAYESLYKMRFQAAIGQLEDMNRVGFVRHDIARMKTVLRERELAARAQGGAQ